MMRQQRHTYETTLSFGGDTPTAEIEVEFSYTVIWGRPAQTYGPAERCYPADPDEIDDIRVVSVDGKLSGWSEYESDASFAEMLILHLPDRDTERMLEEASEREVEDYEDAMERRWEDAREGQP